MEENKNNIVEEKEIDLLALANKIWVNKKFILKALGVGFVIGLIVAFSIPKEYTTTVLLAPESSLSANSEMSPLIALAGINMGQVGGTAIASPELYPDVFQSTPFLKGLFNVNVRDIKRGIDTTLYAYLDNGQKTAWWSYVKEFPSLLIDVFSSTELQEDKDVSDNSVISKEEMKVIVNLQKRLSVSSDKKTGIITITSTMQSPRISAYIADTLASYLQTYIINYRTQKARNDLLYTEKLYEESQKNYYESQKNLAVFVDANINVVSAKYRTTQERLQNEANLMYSIYNQMAQQMQMSKIKIQDTTPVFTVIQPAVQPLKSSGLSKKIILLGFLFISLIGAISWILRMDIWCILKKN